MSERQGQQESLWHMEIRGDTDKPDRSVAAARQPLPSQRGEKSFDPRPARFHGRSAQHSTHLTAVWISLDVMVGFLL